MNIHPDAQQLTDMSDAWLVARFGDLPSAHGSFKPDHLVKSRFQLLVCYGCANGMGYRLKPFVKMLGSISMIDNILDDPGEMGAHPARAKDLVTSVLGVLEGRIPVHQPSSPTCGFVRVMSDTTAEWWGEICEEMPATQQARFIQIFKDYLEASLRQVPYREARNLPDMKTFQRMRADSLGWYPLAVLIEYALGIELDQEALTHPLLLDLREAVCYHICWVNDIISFKKEYAQGDFCNVVAVLYSERTASGAAAADLQEIVLEVSNMIQHKDEECVRLLSQIKESSLLMAKPGMAAYLQSLANWVAGHLYWTLNNERFTAA